MRNNFTKIFGRVGKRRTVLTGRIKVRTKAFNWRYWHSGITGRKHRTKMQMTRRAHQGWRNRIIGTIEAIKIRLKYGRRKPVAQFRR